MKKWPVFNRLWHWVNALLLIALILLAQFDHTPLEEQMFAWHVKIGFVFAFFLCLRFAYLPKDKKNIQHARQVVLEGIRIFREKKAMMNDHDKFLVKKAGAKLSYIALAVCLMGMMLSGLCMVFAPQIGLESLRPFFK